MLKKKIKEIKKAVAGFKVKQLLRTYIKQIVIFGIYLQGSFLFAVLMVFTGIQPLYARIFFLFLISSASVTVIYRIIKIHKTRPLSLEHLNLEIEKQAPEIEDKIINSVSLSRKFDSFNPVSKIMIERLVENTAEEIKKLSGNVLSLKDFYGHIFKFALLFLLFFSASSISKPFKSSALKFLDTFSENYRYYIQLKPGNSSVARGGDFVVTAFTNMPSAPVIEVKRLDGEFKDNFARISDSTFTYRIKDISEETFYRALAPSGRYRTKWYEIKVKRPPEAEKIQITYNYPAYTGYKTVVSTNPVIKALRGTSVEIKCNATEKLRRAAVVTDSGKRKMTIPSEKTALTSFLIENQTFYKIELEDRAGMVNRSSPKYQIIPVEDAAPAVELYSPEADISVSADSKVKIEGSVSDDIGLKRIYVQYHIDISGKNKEQSIKILSDSVKHQNFSYIWDIARTDAVPGSILTCRIAAEDTNTLYGPGTGYSREFRIEVKGFEDKHKNLLERTQQFQEKVLNTLAESYEISAELAIPDYDNALDKLPDFRENTEKLEKMLEDIIKEMEEDPYTEKSTIDEYKGILNSAKNIKGKTSKLQKTVSEKNPQSREISKEIEQELERMVKLSADVLKRERMSDVMSSSSDSLEKARDLADMLNNPDAAPEDIRRKLDKLKSLLKQLRQSIKDFPSELPEEFINKESVKNIDFSKSQGALEKLEAALRAGNYDQAREILKELVGSLRQMMKTLQDAAGESHKSRREKLISRTNELQSEIKRVIEVQKKIIDTTEDVFEIAEYQKNIFEKNRINELREKYEILKATAGIYMREIDKEFEKGYLYRTRELLEKRAEKVQDEWRKQKINEFIKELKYRPEESKFLDETRKETLNGLSKQQTGNKEAAVNIREGLESLSHMTALMDNAAIENLTLSSMFMGKASLSLSEHQPSAALPNERRALAYLMELDNNMQSFMKKLNRIPQQLNAGSASGYRQTQQENAYGGRSGFREGYVEIPSRGEEISGREFRKMILEALREKHPEKYKKLIEEYFKSLSE